MEQSATKAAAGQDYPRDWSQFLDWFTDEEECLKYLERLRWPAGFICPRCKQKNEPFRASRGRLMCRQCRHQSTVTAGTLFDKTRTPLKTWFAAVWYVTNQKHGVSALGLQRVLGLGSYQTAWTMLHRLRRAMVRQDRARLSGTVEVDETYVDIPDPLRELQKTQQSHTHSVLVAMAVEVLEPKGFGRIRLQRVRGSSAQELIPFVRAAVEPGASVHTDGSAAYRSLEECGYRHRAKVQLGSRKPPHLSLPAVHRIASLLKRWLLGTHQGAVSSKQLDYYLDEFTFRFNRRTSRSRGLLFYRLLTQAAIAAPVTYRQVTTAKPATR